MNPPTKHTSQAIDNWSFDEGLKVKIVEIIGQDGVLKNPATEEKQDSIISAIENVSVSVDTTGLATEAKQDDMITAINGISGGTSYNYIQSAENESGYNYDGFASSSGWKIMRETIATAKMQYALGTGDYDTAWADRVNKSYGN